MDFLSQEMSDLSQFIRNDRLYFSVYTHDFYYVNTSIICHVMTNLPTGLNYAEYHHTVCFDTRGAT